LGPSEALGARDCDRRRVQEANLWRIDPLKRAAGSHPSVSAGPGGLMAEPHRRRPNAKKPAGCRYPNPDQGTYLSDSRVCPPSKKDRLCLPTYCEKAVCFVEAVIGGGHLIRGARNPRPIQVGSHTFNPGSYRWPQQTPELSGPLCLGLIGGAGGALAWRIAEASADVSRYDGQACATPGRMHTTFLRIVQSWPCSGQKAEEYCFLHRYAQGPMATTRVKLAPCWNHWTRNDPDSNPLVCSPENLSLPEMGAPVIRRHSVGVIGRGFSYEDGSTQQLRAGIEPDGASRAQNHHSARALYCRRRCGKLIPYALCRSSRIGPLYTTKCEKQRTAS